MSDHPLWMAASLPSSCCCSKPLGLWLLAMYILPLAALQVEAGLYVGQLLLLPADLAAAAAAASGAAVAAALAGLPVTGAMAAAGATKRLSNEQFELFLEVRGWVRGCAGARVRGCAGGSAQLQLQVCCVCIHTQ